MCLSVAMSVIGLADAVGTAHGCSPARWPFHAPALKQCCRSRGASGAVAGEQGPASPSAGGAPGMVARHPTEAFAFRRDRAYVTLPLQLPMGDPRGISMGWGHEW